MLAIYKHIELRDYNERGLNYPTFGSVPPFQFESSYENTKVELIGDLTTELPITVERDDGLSYYNGGYEIPLGTYYLRFSNDDGAGQKYYSERFRIIDCVPEKVPTYRDSLHLPIRWFDSVQPISSTGCFVFVKFIVAVAVKLPSFQIVTKLNTSLGVPTVYLCSESGEVELDIDVEVIKLDGKVYYIFYGELASINYGTYYYRVEDSNGIYYSSWFGVGVVGTRITFKNKCDIGGIYFADGFTGNLSLSDTNIGEIEVDVFEEGFNDSAMIFHATDRKTTIRRTLSTNVVGEHIKDFLRRLRYFDEVTIYHENETIDARIVDVTTERMGDGYICNVQFEEKGVVSTVCECRTEAFTVGCVITWMGAGAPDGFSGNVRLMDDGIEGTQLEIHNFYSVVQSANLTFSQLTQPVVIDFSEITVRAIGEVLTDSQIRWSYTDDFAVSFTTKQTDVIREAAMVYVRIPPPPQPFITSWDIPSDDFTFTFPTAPYEGGVYDYYIDWGDGSPEEYFTNDTPPTHEYAQAGEYQISARGSLPRFGFRGDNWEYIGSSVTFLGVDNWGDVGFKTFRLMFASTHFHDFYVNKKLTGHEDVTDMGYMFYDSLFNKDIGEWDVSRITNMEVMFSSAGPSGPSAFNQDIGDWNVSSVTNMICMFRGATAFNQDLSRWCVSQIPSVPSLFSYRATAWQEEYKPQWGQPCT